MSQLFNQNLGYEDLFETNKFGRASFSPERKNFGFEDDMIDTFKPSVGQTKGNQNGML